LVRDDRWKYIWRFPAGPDELYDMQNEPGELQNRAGELECAEVVRQRRARIEAFFNRYADPQYDLWHGGRSKAGRLIGIE
jgi:arylsulfatase A-like enzyme